MLEGIKRDSDCDVWVYFMSQSKITQPQLSTLFSQENYILRLKLITSKLTGINSGTVIVTETAKT